VSQERPALADPRWDDSEDPNRPYAEWELTKGCSVTFLPSLDGGLKLCLRADVEDMGIDEAGFVLVRDVTPEQLEALGGYLLRLADQQRQREGRTP
jgi:hypothetical protein